MHTQFQRYIDPTLLCSIEAEFTSHFFLRCHFFEDLRATSMKDLRNIDSGLSLLSDLSDDNFTNV